jgi:hypothetical protein
MNIRIISLLLSGFFIASSIFFGPTTVTKWKGSTVVGNGTYADNNNLFSTKIAEAALSNGSGDNGRIGSSTSHSPSTPCDPKHSDPDHPCNPLSGIHDLVVPEPKDNSKSSGLRNVTTFFAPGVIKKTKKLTANSCDPDNPCADTPALPTFSHSVPSKSSLATHHTNNNYGPKAYCDPDNPCPPQPCPKGQHWDTNTGSCVWDTAPQTHGSGTTPQPKLLTNNSKGDSVGLVSPSSEEASPLFVNIPAPILNETSFRIFLSHGAAIQGIPLTRPNGLPPALVLSSESRSISRILPLAPAVTFRTPVASNSSASQIFPLFAIPTYPEPPTPNSIYVVPPFVIKQDASSSLNNFVLTPIIEKVFPGMTVLINYSSGVASGLVNVTEIKEQFAKNGTHVGFSFGISDSIPKGLGLPRINATNYALALFLNIDNIQGENESQKIKFSNPNSFISSPQLKILVNKSLNASKLIDGCPSISLLSFNESLVKWENSTKPIRDKAMDIGNECGYILETEHFSKFAVGGIKPTTILLQ